SSLSNTGKSFETCCAVLEKPPPSSTNSTLASALDRSVEVTDTSPCSSFLTSSGLHPLARSGIFPESALHAESEGLRPAPSLKTSQLFPEQRREQSRLLAPQI